MSAQDYQAYQDNLQSSSYLALGAKSVGNLHDPNNPLAPNGGAKKAISDSEQAMINFTSSNPIEKMMVKNLGQVNTGVATSNELLEKIYRALSDNQSNGNGKVTGVLKPEGSLQKGGTTTLLQKGGAATSSQGGAAAVPVPKAPNSSQKVDFDSIADPGDDIDLPKTQEQKVSKPNYRATLPAALPLAKVTTKFAWQKAIKPAMKGAWKGMKGIKRGYNWLSGKLNQSKADRLFNAALKAEKAGNYEKANKYFNCDFHGDRGLSWHQRLQTDFCHAGCHGSGTAHL